MFFGNVCSGGGGELKPVIKKSRTTAERGGINAEINLGHGREK